MMLSYELCQCQGRCELLDDHMVRIINQVNNPDLSDPWPERNTLLYEITGTQTNKDPGRGVSTPKLPLSQGLFNLDFP